MKNQVGGISSDNKLCAICWGKVQEKDLIVDPEDNEYLHPECARKKMEDKLS